MSSPRYRLTVARIFTFHISWKALNALNSVSHNKLMIKLQALWNHRWFQVDDRKCIRIGQYFSVFTKIDGVTQGGVIGHFTPCFSIFWKIYPRRIEAPPLYGPSWGRCLIPRRLVLHWRLGAIGLQRPMCFHILFVRWLTTVGRRITISWCGYEAISGV